MINIKRLMTCLSAYALCIAILPLSVSAKQGIMAQEEPAIELSWNDSAEEELPASEGETEMIPPENENLTIEVQPFEHCQLIVRADGKETVCGQYGSSIPAYAGEAVQLEVIPEQNEKYIYAIDSLKAGAPDGHVPEGSLYGNVYSFTMPDYTTVLYVQMKQGIHMQPCDHGSVHVTLDDASYDFPAYVVTAEPEEGYVTSRIIAENQSGDVIVYYEDQNTVIVNRDQTSMVYARAEFDRPFAINRENCEYADIRTTVHGIEADQAAPGIPVHIEITNVNPLYEQTALRVIDEEGNEYPVNADTMEFRMPKTDVYVRPEFKHIEHAVEYIGDNGEQLIAYNVMDVYDISETDYVLRDGAWYYVDTDRTFIGVRPSVHGTVNIILKDSSRFDPKRGIEVGQGNTLHIWCQKQGTGTLKSLIARVFRPSSDYHAVLGGNEGENGGTINIHGGYIQLQANNDAAAIGGGKNGNGGTINIYGGNLDLRGAENAAVIGGGNKGYGGSINIYGGTIDVNTNRFGAGIGGGCDADSGVIRISGGTVTARGGEGAAGIGGGKNGNGTHITISGGTVRAYGGSSFCSGVGAGIGGGDEGNSGVIEILGGRVFAESLFVGGIFDDYQGAGIGGGNDGSAQNIIIEGDYVESHGWQAFGKGNDGDSEGALWLADDIWAESSGTVFPKQDTYNLARQRDIILRRIPS